MIFEPTHPIPGHSCARNGEPAIAYSMARPNILPEALDLPTILCITSFPPRECGIATYSQDLAGALENKFQQSFRLLICPLEYDGEWYRYENAPTYHLHADQAESYKKLAVNINRDDNLNLVMIQHEFGLFRKQEHAFIEMLKTIEKPVVVVFHTVLPEPESVLRKMVRSIATHASKIVVMTQSSALILETEYGLNRANIAVIPHGTHLVPHLDKAILKQKHDLAQHKVLSTFGLLGPGKNIETTLKALPAIVKKHPDVLFLILGKTHPGVVKSAGELYRQSLAQMVAELQLEKHVRFINRFLTLPELLEFLQLTDIYLFTSHDPNQAVSGTFSYAMSSGCPIISTPIPHAREVLGSDAGIIVDYNNPDQLAAAAISLLENDNLQKSISSNALHRMASTAWENSALAHAALFNALIPEKMEWHYRLPAINLNHVQRLTTAFGMIQFSTINLPDIKSGYTIDDNARALVAMCQHYRHTQDETDLTYIRIYLNFIQFCLRPDGSFLNYVDEKKTFTAQNAENLEDANGRAIWALGYVTAQRKILPEDIYVMASDTLKAAICNVHNIHSTRAMAFIIKGLYYQNLNSKSILDVNLIRQLANRLLQMYRHEAEADWLWYESYLTYANSILPEAMLCAWLATGDVVYKETARKTFDFLLGKIFVNNHIRVVSNRGWLKKGEEKNCEQKGGEQPIDVAYTIMALHKFHEVYPNAGYSTHMVAAMNWFLGDNHLNQIMYNPCTGGCYDGLESHYVNLNQGAESTVSYLMARMTMESWTGKKTPNKQPALSLWE